MIGRPAVTLGKGKPLATTTWYPVSYAGYMSFYNGNLSISNATGNSDYTRSVRKKTGGKYYFETVFQNPDGGTGVGAGYGTGIADAATMYYANGYIYNNGTGTYNSGFSYTSGDVIGVAVDFTNRLVWFSKNGSWVNGNPSAGTGGTNLDNSMPNYGCLREQGDGTNTVTSTTNFGGKAFAYTPPPGFQKYTAN